MRSFVILLLVHCTFLIASASTCFNLTCLIKNIRRKPSEDKVILPTPTVELIQWLQRFFGYSAIVYCPADELKAKACKYCKIPFFGQGIQEYQFFSKKAWFSGSFAGFTTVNDYKKEIIVAFRGSSSKWNLVTDFLFFHAGPAVVRQLSAKLPSNVGLHRGFLGAYLQVQYYVQTQLTALIQNYSTYEVVFTGHSLGGALANIALIDAIGPGGYLAGKLSPNQTSMVTFGTPRVGNSAFSAMIKQMSLKRLARLVNKYDPVPRLPPIEANYSHHPGEVFVDEDSYTARYCDDLVRGGEDTTCSLRIDEREFKVNSHRQYLGLRIDGACIHNRTLEKLVDKTRKV